MTVSNSFLEMLIQQGRNVLNHMKDLRWVAGKQGKDRTSLIERFTANQHSFNVYTYANEEVKQSAEVKAFQEKVMLFSNEFHAARFDIEGVVDEDKVNILYEEVLAAYNEMVIALGFDKEIVNVNRF
ncbi:hypothetical protein MTP04_18200 [Lysinibacillus sp. PLM2]|nr:hypothetical protein MTP04_18200 [Lysinibacillus sp. PLM2]